MLAKVDGVYNAVEVEGDLCGKVLFHGMGAGRGPTTSAVVGDVIEIAREMASATPPAPRVPLDHHFPLQPIGDLQTRYYLRLNVTDRAGVLAQIARILGDGNISIASVLQKDTNPAEQTAEIVITTHPSREASVQEALRLIAELQVVREVKNFLRIET
jgi:homoserine dehydrogenase